MSGDRHERLVVDRLRADHFGGQHDITLDLGDTGLVVVHGPNESGKTTFATLLTWLLVGPTGTHTESLRFGRPDDRVGGSLHGRLGDHPLRIDGTFRLLKRGLPNTNAMTMTVGGRSLTLDEWRSRLSGIDASVFTATYRMWGATLHDGDEVLAEIAQAALAGLAGSRRVHEVSDALDRRVRELVTSRAADADSWSRLMSRITTEHDEVRRIGSRAVEYRAAADRQVELGDLIDTTRREVADLSALATSLDVLRSVTEERRAAEELTDRIAQLGDVPDGWREVIDDVAGLETAARAVDTATDAVTALDRTVLRTAAALGVEEPIPGLRVTHQVVTNVKVGSSELEAERRRLAEAEEERTRVAALRREADELADAARAACPELDGRSPRPLDDVAELRTAIQEWSIADDRVASVQADVADQRRRCDQAEADQRIAHEAWARFGTGSTAQHWRIAPATPGRRTPGWPIWVLPVVAALLTAAAVVILPRWFAVAFTVAAGATVAALMLRTPQAVNGRSGGGAGEAGTAAPGDIEAAATAVIAADASVDAERRELERLEADLGRVRVLLDERRRSADQVCGRFGITALGSPDDTARLVDRAGRATAAITAADAALRTERDASDRVARHDVAIRERITRLQTVLRDAGVPDGVRWDDAVHQIDGWRELSELVTERQLAADALQRARHEVDTRLVALGETVDHRRLDLLVAEAHRWRELSDERRRLDGERAEMVRAVEARLRHDDVARALSDAGLSDPSLRERRTEVTADLLTANDRLESLLDERGRLTEQMARLAEHESLAAARLAIGELQERADARLHEGAVHLVARALLARTATARRRTHQPALVARAGELLRVVTPDWEQLLLDPDESGSAEVTLLDRAGRELPLRCASTGARAVTQLALRLATAELDAERRGVRIPIIADDPLVHLDDDRAAAVMPLLARAADDGHQVIVFTCHQRTVAAATAHGAHVVPIV